VNPAQALTALTGQPNFFQIAQQNPQMLEYLLSLGGGANNSSMGGANNSSMGGGANNSSNLNSANNSNSNENESPQNHPGHVTAAIAQENSDASSNFIRMEMKREKDKNDAKDYVREIIMQYFNPCFFRQEIDSKVKKKKFLFFENS
jgi:hypothetical protein